MKTFILAFAMQLLISSKNPAQVHSSRNLIPSSYTDESAVTRYGYYNKDSMVFITCSGDKIKVADANAITPYANPCGNNPVQPPMLHDSLELHNNRLLIQTQKPSNTK